MNTDTRRSTKVTASLLKALASPARLSILLAIGEGEACVCHLEASLGIRQATISQHLMALRRSGVLIDRRDGRFVYYRLAAPTLLDLVRRAGRAAGVELLPAPSGESCPCPPCAERRGPSSRSTQTARRRRPADQEV